MKLCGFSFNFVYHVPLLTFLICKLSHSTPVSPIQIHLASHFSGKILISEQATEFLNFCSSFPQSCDLSYCLVSFEGRQPRLHPLYQIYVFFCCGILFART